ncbi:hypothetical protein BKA18_004224 [Streptomyces auratus]
MDTCGAGGAIRRLGVLVTSVNNARDQYTQCCDRDGPP